MEKYVSANVSPENNLSNESAKQNSENKIVRFKNL